MILSNEPGYYKEGEYGIRIENLILAKEKDEKHLYFETITFAPIDKNLIDVSLLTREEKDWLNHYHEEVFKKLSPLVEEPVLSWLEEATSAI
jgi:Xaa-Pro aminopeptidase